jgi:probable blue pigment (indigoidine) exporter
VLAITSLVWGASYVFIREGLVYGATPLAFASARYLLSAAAFAVLAVARREAFPARRALLLSASVGGVLVIGFYGGFLYWGEQFTTGGYAAVLASTAPIMTVVVGFSLLPAERLGSVGLVGLGVGFAGAAILVLPQLYGTAIGTWEGPPFILAAMASASLGTVLLRRWNPHRQGLWQIGTQFAVAGGMLAAAAAALPTPEALPATSGVLATLAALVLLSSVIGYFAYYTLHHRVGPIRANLVAYLAPLVGVAVGSGLFGEPLTPYELAGVAVVLVGVTLVLRESARRAHLGRVPEAPPTRGGNHAESREVT